MLLKMALCLLWGITMFSVCGTNDDRNWAVWYPPLFYALKGEDVSLNSNFDFPAEQKHVESIWFKSLNETECPGGEPNSSVVLKKSDKYQIATEPHVSKLTIRAVDIHDAGRYCFRFKTQGVANVFTGRQGTWLQVHAVPEISEFSLKADLKENIINNITCGVSNAYPNKSLNIIICKDILQGNESLSERQETDKTFTVTKTLTFTPTKFHHHQNCTCNVTHITLHQPLLKTVILKFNNNSFIGLGVGITFVVFLFLVIIALVYYCKKTKGKNKMMSKNSNHMTNNGVQSKVAEKEKYLESKMEGNNSKENTGEKELVYTEIAFSQKGKQKSKPNEDQQVEMIEYASIAIKRY